MPQFYVLFYANYTILAIQREEAMTPCPPLNTPLQKSMVFVGVAYSLTKD